MITQLIREHYLRLLRLLLCLCLFQTLHVSARGVSHDSETDSLRVAAVSRLTASGTIDPSSFAMLITDLETGETVAEYNPDLPLVPASIMKSFTIATLLHERDPKWKYTTKVYTDGKISGGVLHGNILIDASGDPSVNSVHEPKTPDFISEIINALKQSKIDSIAGRIIIDESLYAGPAYPSSWAGGDLSASYGTGSHAFNFENNASGKSAIQNISSHFIAKLSRLLASNHIALGNNDLPEGRRKLLVAHSSAELEEIMRSCMMRSDNLYAECFLRNFSESAGGDGSTQSGTELERKLWKNKKAPLEGVTIIDGSGLSRSNRLTARFLTFVLADMAGDVEYVSFFPLAGQEGTLRNFMKDTRLDSYLAMKTGSMKGIQCYAGYLLDEDFAPTHTVVIMVNNMKGERSRLRSDLSQFFLSIF